MQTAFEDALHGRTERYREWLDPVPGAPRRRRVTHVELYDATLRDGMQGEGLSLTAAEKLRVAHALDELGIAPRSRPGFPSSNPKELELFGLLARRAASRPRRSRRSG